MLSLKFALNPTDSYWGWKDGLQTCFILIKNFAILILQGSFHSLEPTKPFFKSQVFSLALGTRPIVSPNG